MKTIIYIVLGILYYAYKFSKNKKKKLEEQNSSEQRYDETSESKTKPVAQYEEEEPKGFEDMLEELVAKKTIPKKEIKLDTVNTPTFDNSDWNQFQQQKAAKKEIA